MSKIEREAFVDCFIDRFDFCVSKIFLHELVKHTLMAGSQNQAKNQKHHQKKPRKTLSGQTMLCDTKDSTKEVECATPNTLTKYQVLNFFTTNVDNLYDDESNPKCYHDRNPNIHVEHHEHFLELRIWCACERRKSKMKITKKQNHLIHQVE
jgi:hypothetical protein